MGNAEYMGALLLALLLLGRPTNFNYFL